MHIIVKFEGATVGYLKPHPRQFPRNKCIQIPLYTLDTYRGNILYSPALIPYSKRINPAITQRSIEIPNFNENLCPDRGPLIN